MKKQRPFLDMDFMGYQQKIFNRTGKVPTHKEYCEYLDKEKNLNESCGGYQPTEDNEVYTLDGDA